MKKSSLIVFFLIIISNACLCQELKVTGSNRNMINRVHDGTSMIIFSSSIPDLRVETTYGEDFVIIPESGKRSSHILTIDVIKELTVDSFPFCERSITLKCSKTPDYEMEKILISPNQVLYYTVVLPNQFSTTLTAEYLFSKTTKHGIRLSFGKRIGGYVSFKWGDYKPKGENIDDVTMDCDVTNANHLGFIRTSFNAGLRLGLFQKEIVKSRSALYLLMGGGYGEYGRQWNNQHFVGNSSYFYSDYIKGFNGEAAVQCVLFDWLCCSVGIDMVIGNGKISTDYQIGVGVNLNVDKISKRKRSVQ